MSLAFVRAERALRQRGAALVVDIDGTLAADVARRHLRPVEDPHCLGDVPLEQIERYMTPDLVAKDEPIEGAAHALASLLFGSCCRWFRPQPVSVTARWDTLRPTTTRWLAKHYPWLGPLLLMRRQGDPRPSVDVKLELVLQCYRTGVWVDDDPAMLAAAEQHGFVALKAPDVYQTATTTPQTPQRSRWQREREYLSKRDPRVRFLAATAPERTPCAAPLCLCGEDETCALCAEEDDR